MVLLGFEINTTSDVVAWYGAVVATTVAVVNIVTLFQDRRRIKVKYQRHMQVTGPMGTLPPYDENKDYLVIEVVNIGKRPATIQNVGVEYLAGGGMIASNSLIDGPHTLEEGRKYQVLVEEDLIDWRKIANLFASDATGKVYRMKIASFWRRLWWYPIRRFKNRSR